MPRTTNKGIRFTDAELERVEKLRAQLLEYSSEAELLHHAALLGILVLATYATDDLAALLKPRLMPAIDFLVERGGLPMLVLAQLDRGSAQLATAVIPEERGAAAKIDEVVAEHLEGLGTGFIDED
jgi:hypothetical protein